MHPFGLMSLRNPPQAEIANKISKFIPACQNIFPIKTQLSPFSSNSISRTVFPIQFSCYSFQFIQEKKLSISVTIIFCKRNTRPFTRKVHFFHSPHMQEGLFKNTVCLQSVNTRGISTINMTNEFRVIEICTKPYAAQNPDSQ